MFLRITWYDRRLIPGNITEEEHISINPSFIKHLWSPDLYFYGGRDYKTLKLFNENALLWLYGNKMVMYSLL